MLGQDNGCLFIGALTVLSPEGPGAELSPRTPSAGDPPHPSFSLREAHGSQH